jgi:hypothetical protein
MKETDFWMRQIPGLAAIEMAALCIEDFDQNIHGEPTISTDYEVHPPK